MVYLHSVRHDVADYHITTDKFVTKLRVTGWLFPRLKLNWPSLNYRHQRIEYIQQLPDSVRLSWIQAFQLKGILSAPHYILLFYRSGRDKWFPLPLHDTTWQTAPLTAIKPVNLVPSTVGPVVQYATKYPSLNLGLAGPSTQY